MGISIIRPTKKNREYTKGTIKGMFLIIKSIMGREYTS
jgi:hypothetical protein